MATTIDQKVVEMKFNNKDFEKNTRQTMSTLDKLKSKLNFSGASKGLEEVGKAGKKVDMSGLASGVQAVQARFSAMEVVAVTALANITNSVVNLGKNMLRSLTIDPIKSGFSEYEMMLGSIQTTMAGTGKSAKEVEYELKKLDEYADKTIYSTSDMLSNLPKFTNAGVDLTVARKAMIGISNATALAGGDANKASIAFYNLGQAIGTGYLTRMDYNSINNAGIATMEWKNQMVKAAIAAGTLKKVGDGLYKAGNRTFTLQQLFIDGLQEQWATTDVMLKVFGDYGDQTTEIGARAWDAAQKIKTYSMMMDSLKATAGTGWKDTWQLMFGGLDEAARVWTGLNEFISKIITSMAKWRNTILNIAMNNPFTDLFEKINNKPTIKAFNEVNDKVKKSSKTLAEYKNMIRRIWRGDFKNNPYRKALVEQEGFNFEVTQSLVDQTAKLDKNGQGWKQIGKITEKHVIAAEKKYGVRVEQTTQAMKEETKVVEELTDKRLKQMGLSEDEIAMYRQLEKGAKKYGLSIEEVAAIMDEANGRELLFGSEDGKVTGAFQHIGAALINVFNKIKEAWTETFIGITGVDLYVLISKFNKFTESIENATKSEKGMRNLKDTFKGLFAIIKLVTTITGGGLKIAWTIFKTILETCGMTVLDFTGALGNLISKFVDFITKNNYVINGIVFLTKIIAGSIKSVYQWGANLLSVNDFIHKVQNGLNNFGKDFKSWVKGFKTADDIPKYIMSGLINGIKKYGGKVWNSITTFAGTLITAVRDKLGIQSPSTEFFDIGKNIVLGLFNGIGSLIGMVYTLITTIGQKIISIIKDLDIGSIIVATISAGAVIGIIKLAKAFTVLADGLQNVNAVIAGFANVEYAFAGLLKAAKLKVITSSLKDIAIAIAILSASVWALSSIEKDKLWASVNAIGGLVAFIGVLTVVAGSFGKEQALEFGKLALTILAIGIALKMVASALKKISDIKSLSTGPIIAFGALVVAFLVILKLLGGPTGNNLTKMNVAIIGMGIGILLMAKVIGYLGKLDPEIVGQGLLAFSMFEKLIIILMAATKLMGNGDDIKAFGKMMLGIGFSLILMGRVVKMLGKLEPAQLAKGLAAILVFEKMIIALMIVSKIAGNGNVDGIGKAIAGIGLAILLMGMTVKLLGNMDPKKLAKGIIAVGLFSGIIIGLIKAVKSTGGSDCKKLGVTLLGIAVAIGVMSLSCALLSIMDVKSLAKGITAVGFLSLFMMGLIKATSGQHIISSKALWAMVGAIAVMSICVALLSLINPKKLVAPTAALGILMTAFGVMIKCSKDLGKEKGMIKNLGLMIGVIAILTAVTYLLSKINGENAIQSATALGIIAASLMSSLYGLKKTGKINYKKLLSQLVGMIGLLGVMYIATLVLKQLSGVKDLIEPAMALSLFMGAMALLVFAIGNMKVNPKDLITGLLGLLALCLTLIPLIAVIGLVSLSDNAPKTILALTGFVGMLAVMLLAIAASGAIYAATGGVALLGLVGLVALLPIMVGLLAIIAAMSKIKDAEKNCKLLTSLMAVMTSMLLKISLVGPLALMGVTALGALMIMMPILIAFATALGALFTMVPQLQQFLDTGLPIMIQVAGGLGQMIGAFVSGALTEISAALPVIGTNLSLFMTNATPFIEGMKTVNKKVLAGVAIMTGAILALTVAQFLNGIVSLFPFCGKLSDLGTELSLFTLNAFPFMVTMSTIPASAMNGVKSLAGAVLCLTAANLLDGLSRFLGGGGSSLSKFGEQLPPLGTSLSEFVTKLGVFGKEQIATTDCAGKAIEALANASKKLPKTGGIWQRLFGEGGFAKFSKEIPDVGSAVSKFVSNLGEFGKNQIETAKAACEVIKALADAAKAVGNDGGIWQGLFGSKSKGLAKFADKMPKVGEGVKGFIDELKDVKDKADVAQAGADIIASLAKLAKIDFDKANKNIPKFGDTMTNYASKLSIFITSLKSFSKDDIKLTNDNLTLMVKAVTNMMNTIGDEIIDNSGTITGNMTTVATQAAKAIEGKTVTDELATQALNFVKGFANGIKKNKGLAKEAAKEVAGEALSGSKTKLDEHSPSKETEEQGEYFGEGFIIGIEKYASRIYNVSANVGNEAKRGLTTAISKISSLVESNVNASPTIRPVLDLSDVTEGANSINSMFNNPSMQVAANLSSISTGMSNKNQNGNSEVISAINKLGKNLGNTSGNTYNINGITYDESSSINRAVQDLIRAVEIERRM